MNQRIHSEIERFMIDTRLAALDFHADIGRLTKDFTGREWLFEEIDNWLCNSDQRFFILAGEPGAGKSAIAARLIQTYPDNIAAYHFCIAGNVGTITPNTVLRSVAAQLGESLSKYGEALANTIKPHQVSINVKQEIGKVEAGGKVVGVVINHLTASNPEEELDILFRAPLTELAPPDIPIFILIDSLDEAMTYQGHISLITLLAKTNDLPQWVRFVCTTRPEQRVLSYFRQFEPFLLAAESSQNLADISQYIACRMSKETMKVHLNAANVAPEDLAKRLAGLAGGNFLYTKVLLDDIEAGQQQLDNLTTLPQNLDEIYHGFLRRFSNKDWDEFYQPLLGKLAVVQEPITEKQLANFTGIRQRQIRRSIAVVSQYLNVLEDGEGTKTYRLFHQSLRDYLLDEERSDMFWCDPEEEHEIIANFYTKLCYDKWSCCDSYGLRYLPYHLAAAGQTNSLRQLLLEFNWLQAKLQATDIYALIADFILSPGDNDIEAVQAALQLSAHILVADRDQLAPHLLGRLLNRQEPVIQALLSVATKTQHSRRPWLKPLKNCLNSPSGLMQQVLNGHRDRINALDISHNGNLVVSASDDKTVKVWDLKNGRLLLDLRGHNAHVKAVAVTHDDNMVLSGSYDGVIKAWNLSSGSEIMTLHGHKGCINALAVSPNSRYVLSAAEDHLIKVWIIANGTELFTLKGHNSRVCSITVTPDGNYALSSSWDRTVRIWDLSNGTEIKSLETNDAGASNRVCTFLEGQRAVSSHFSQFIIWNLEDYTRITSQKEECPNVREDPISAIDITQDGKLVLSSCWEQIEVWAPENKRKLGYFIGHTDKVTDLKITPDGNRVISSSWDQTLRIWDLKPEKIARQNINQCNRIIALSTLFDDMLVLEVSQDGSLTLWDLSNANHVVTLHAHKDLITSIWAVSDKNQLFTASEDGTIKMWDLDKRVELLCIKVPNNEIVTKLSYNGKQLVSVSKCLR